MRTNVEIGGKKGRIVQEMISISLVGVADEKLRCPKTGQNMSHNGRDDVR